MKRREGALSENGNWLCFFISLNARSSCPESGIGFVLQNHFCCLRAFTETALGNGTPFPYIADEAWRGGQAYRQGTEEAGLWFLRRV
jgi:hypothetical protein